MRGCTAESLPFEDQSFDAAMAVATVDHWQDPIAGLREMRHVARRVVEFTTDASDPDRFWLTRDGFDEAYWRRPEAYLDDHVRRGMSIWARVGPDPEQRATHSLRDDLASGRCLSPDPATAAGSRFEGPPFRVAMMLSF